MPLELILSLAVMTAVSYALRAGGFWAMRFVKLSDGVRAWLSGIPIAIMGAVLAPAAAKGGPAEWLGFAVTFIAMKATGSDILAVLGGVVAVAAARYFLA